MPVGRWMVVVPLPAVMELDVLPANASPLSEATKAAIAFVASHANRPSANTVPPTSLLPSALRAVGRPPKPSSTSSVSFEVVPPISEIPPIDGNLYDDDDYDQLPPPPPPPPPQKQSQLRGQRTPTLLHTATPTCSRSS
ncbi:hypothetical protein BJV78DRAFT_1290045, partial [Lactifluus subvellereus]